MTERESLRLIQERVNTIDEGRMGMQSRILIVDQIQSILGVRFTNDMHVPRV